MWNWLSQWRSARARRRRAERSYREIYENISDGIYRSSLGRKQLSANPALVRLNGYDSEAEMLAAVRDLDTEWYVEPGRRAEFQKILHAEGRVSDFVSEIYRHKTRERIWITETARLVRDETSGEPMYYEGTVREITDTVQRLELQQRYEKLASMVLGCLYQFRLRTDGSTAFPYASVGMKRLFGLEPADVANDSAAFLRRLHPDDAKRFQASMLQAAANLAPWTLEFRVILPGGEERWVFTNAAAEREADGSTLWHGFFTDVTQRKENEKRIEALAFCDPLTNLANRRLMGERLEAAVEESGAHGEYGAVLFIDLDDFKALNDAWGHSFGDMMLNAVAQLLRASVREGDTAARAGGDEFVLILPRLGSDLTSAAGFAESIRARLVAAGNEPWLIDGRECRLTFSTGVALFQGNGMSADHVLSRADTAMYEAKAERRHRERDFTGGPQLCLVKPQPEGSVPEGRLAAE